MSEGFGAIRAALDQRLSSLLDGAVSGRGGLLLLTGPAGAGKTTTAAALAERALELGGAVHAVAAVPPAPSRPSGCSGASPRWPVCRSRPATTRSSATVPPWSCSARSIRRRRW